MPAAKNNDIEPGDPPRIDPTTLTTHQLDRAVSCLHEVFDSKLHGLMVDLTTRKEMFDSNLRAVSKNLETRLDGMDKAVELLRQTTDKIPALIKDAVDRLESLHAEKFSSIATQFVERDKRTEQLSLADKTAIAAALQAQKEAAGATNESSSTANTKTETNFAKLIDQTQALLLEVRRNTDEKIDDVKTRLDRGEGQMLVSDPATAKAIADLIREVRDLKMGESKIAGRDQGIAAIWAFVVGGIGLLVSVIAIAAAFRPH